MTSWCLNLARSCATNVAKRPVRPRAGAGRGLGFGGGVSAAAVIGTCWLLTPRSAAAFTIQSAATRGCHEEVTIDAWRRTRADLPELTAPFPSVGEDEALIADLPFNVPEDLQEIGLVTLLLGIRQNDIGDLGATALSDLAQVNSDPKAQSAHCLRAPSQNEPDGTEQALDDCHDFMREAFSSAIDALGNDGEPDPSVRDELEVTLAIRGKVKVRVPAFQLRAAHGIHALQDSFTHTYRNPENPLKIRVLLNFSEFAENRLNEAVDGPPHSQELDRCDDADALRTERHELAIEASAATLRALLEPKDRKSKLKAIDEVIAHYTSFDAGSGCTLDNGWCDAPEHAYSTTACACRAAGAAAPGQTRPVLGAGALALLLGVVRSGRKLRKRLGYVTLAAGCAFGLSARSAHADETRTISPPVAALEGNSSAARVGRADPAGTFLARVTLAAAYDKPGFAGGLGLRYQFSHPWMVGFDAEWNPWLAITPGKLRAGTVNAYITMIRRFHLRDEAVNIRSGVALGGSYMLFDLVGAPAGSFGPYFGLSLLGVEWKVARGFYLTFDPTYIAFPIPHITGVPFGYLQYRALVGLEFGG